MYHRVLKPVLFQLPPEGAHRFAISTLRLPLPWGRIGDPVNDQRLRTRIADLVLANPVGLAAGFDKNCRALRSLGRLGFGYVVGGTVTAAPRAGNPKPRISRDVERRSMLNAMSFPNHGAAAAAHQLSRLRKTAPTFVSISDERVDDLIWTAGLLEPQVDGFELNVSCPNVSWGQGQEIARRLDRSLSALRAMTEKCLFVKTPPYRTATERAAVLDLVRIAQDHRVDGLTLSNAPAAPSPGLSMATAGLSGKAVFQDTLRIVRDIYSVTSGNLPLNACGGIFNAADALACVRAGATTVQLYTGFIYEGPRIVHDITAGLRAALGDNSAALASQVGTAA